MRPVDPGHAAAALRHALDRHPGFARYQPRLARVPVFRGDTLTVQYGADERPTGAEAWDFQDLAIKEYRRLSGER